MRAEGEGRFPPGEIGKSFNMIGDLRDGEFVYVRMQVRRAQPSDTDAFACKMLMPSASSSFADAFQVLWVPRSQIVCREPKAMEADNGVVRGIG
jgi:hypothetical protein